MVYQSDSTNRLIELEPQLYFVRIVRQDGLVEVHKVAVEQVNYFSNILEMADMLGAFVNR